MPTIIFAFPLHQSRSFLLLRERIFFATEREEGWEWGRNGENEMEGENTKRWWGFVSLSDVLVVLGGGGHGMVETAKVRWFTANGHLLRRPEFMRWALRFFLFFFSVLSLLLLIYTLTFASFLLILPFIFENSIYTLYNKKNLYFHCWSIKLKQRLNINASMNDFFETKIYIIYIIWINNK